MKKKISLLLSIIMIIGMISFTALAAEPAFSGGDGTVNNPYKISTEEDLRSLASIVNSATPTDNPEICAKVEGNLVDGKLYNAPYTTLYNVYTGKYFVLTNDITMKKSPFWQAIGNDGTRMFNGTFDGNGYVIKNLYFEDWYANREGYNAHVGLFGMTGQNVTIKNLGIENAQYWYFGNNLQSKKGVHGVGALIGTASGGVVDSCFVKDSLIGNSIAHGNTSAVGGLIGQAFSLQCDSNPTLTITNCYVNGMEFQVEDSRVGGLMGGDMPEVPFGGTEVSVPAMCGAVPANAVYNNGEQVDATFKGWGVDDNDLTHFKVQININNCYTCGLKFYKSFNNRTQTSEKRNSVIHILKGYVDAKNCYSDAAVKDLDGVVPTVFADAAALNGYLVTNDPTCGFKADSVVAPTNGGYPIILAKSIPEDDADDRFEGGLGTQAYPYLIKNAEQLRNFANIVNNASIESTPKICKKIDGTLDSNDHWINPAYTELYSVFEGKYFKLIADIDLENTEWTPIGINKNAFDGYFDGDGHIIRNVKITEDYNLVGFFGLTGQNISIKNLGIENADYSFNNNNGKRVYGAGGFAAAVSGGTIESCFVKNIKIENKQLWNSAVSVGGFIGHGYAMRFGEKKTATINNCYVSKVEFKESPSTTGAFIGKDYEKISDATSFPTDKVYYADSSHTMTDAYWNNYYQWFVTYVTVNNCYVRDASYIDTNTDAGASDMYAFGQITNANNSKFTAVNCYTSVTETITNAPLTNGVTKGATYLQAREGLKVDGTTAFKDDNLSWKRNGGFPVLNWETVTPEDYSYEIRQIEFNDGKTIVTVANNNSSYTGSATLYVASYGAEEKLTDVKKSSLAEVTTDGTSKDFEFDINPEEGNKVRVFIWTDGSLTPRCAVSSKIK